MLRNKRTIAFTAIAISVALGATACGSGNGSGQATKGGTLLYYAPSDFDHIDPQRTYTTQGQNIGREIYRSLTGWSQNVGEKAPHLVGDLATDTGTASDGNKTWTFHLRSGVKWQDGSAVTSQDVKYGVERAFSSDISGGPTYAKTWLAGGDKYTGPFKGQELSSIETPNSSTVVFHLNQPVGDFNEATAMETFAAVPKAHDTGATYDTSVWSDGPYQVKSYTHNKELVLVRNTHWTKSVDPLRDQNVDEIDVKMGQDMAAIDQLMKADGTDAQHAIIEDPIAGSDLAPFNNNPVVKKRMHTIAAPGIDYLAMNTTTIKDVRVRQAIAYAINRQTYRSALGGEAYGKYATSFLPPGTDGRKEFTPFASSPAGDVGKAKQLLQQAGVKNLNLSLVVEATPSQENAGTALKNALSQIGINANIKPVDRGTYFNNIGHKANNYDLMWADWIADWPNASTILPILFDGRQIQPDGNNVYSQLNDKTVADKLDKIAAMADPKAANAAYGDLDQYILTTDAPVVPLVYRNFTEMQGSKVGGLTDDTVLAEMNLAHVFVKK